MPRSATKPRSFGVAAARQLVAFLEKSKKRCDNTLKKSVRWMRERNYNVDQGVRYLSTRGGFCDCEVVYNVFGLDRIVKKLPLAKCKPADPWCFRCKCCHKNSCPRERVVTKVTSTYYIAVRRATGKACHHKHKDQVSARDCLGDNAGDIVPVNAVRSRTSRTDRARRKALRAAVARATRR